MLFLLCAQQFWFLVCRARLTRLFSHAQGYGVACANWVPNNPQLDPNYGPIYDPDTGSYYRGCLVNSIYARSYNGRVYELGWYKTYERLDDAQAFAVKFNPATGQYVETPLGRINDDCVVYLGLLHVPGTYDYRGYVNSVPVHYYSGLGISSSWASVGAERFAYGDRTEASWDQLQFMQANSNWAYWGEVIELPITNPDPVYSFYGNSTYNKAKVY